MANKIKKGVGAALLTATLVVGGALTTMPAYAGGSGSAFAGPVNAKANTSTWGGTQGQSYAKHGCKSARSSWSTGKTNAWAACGFDLNSRATYSFR